MEAVYYIVCGIAGVGIFFGCVRESMGKDAPCGIGRLPAWPFFAPACLVAVSFFLFVAYGVIKYIMRFVA